MFTLIQCELSVLIGPCSGIQGCIERRCGKRKKCCFILFEDFRDKAALGIVIMLALHVQVTGRKELGVLDRQILEFRDRDKLIATEVSDFVLDILYE